MMFLWIFVIGGIIWYLIVKGSPPRNNNGYRSSQAKEILDQRFAKGEIDESTYQKMKSQLEEEER